MKAANTVKTSSPVNHHWVREGTLIALLATSAYLLLSLGTYNAGDPGWSGTGSAEQARNAVGITGAWTADVLFSLFGVMAYLFPVMLLLRCWLLFRDHEPEFLFDWVTLGIRIIGFILVMVSATSLVALNAQQNSILPFGQGGMLGRALADVSLGAFNLIGSRLLLLAIGLFGMTIFADISWLRVMDRLGDWVSKTAISSAVLLREKWSDYQQEKQARASEKLRRTAAPKQVNVIEQRPPPKIQVAPKIQLAPKKVPISNRLQKGKQGRLFDVPVNGEIPPLNLLDEPAHDSTKGYSKAELEALSRLLEFKLKDFNVIAEVVAVYPGPVITRFEIQPAPGTKVSRISNLAKDLARSLAVVSVRVVEVIPGKSVIGIEIPNEDREIVYLREVLASKAYQQSHSMLSLALGHDISGEPVVVDLGKMPHLLVAGTTGSGKSVGVNAMLLSLLYKAPPSEVRLIMIDPKMLELSVYDGIPHLLTPVITDMKDASNGLRWCVGEMERRYKLMSAMGVRNLAGFNKKVKEAAANDRPIADPLWPGDELDPEAKAPNLETLPFIVVVVDEFADMMMIVGKKVEQLIARIAQKARAAGIHLILATQRPSVDVITGLIKANIPTRIAFQVSSKIDSRTILDQGGSEQLLGHGDMLYLPPGSGVPIRVHGAFVADEEVHRVVEDWQKRGEPNYIEGLLEDSGSGTDMLPGMSNGESDEDSDELYDEAVYFVTDSRKASISAVQRKLRVGYNRAARMIEMMEAEGVVSEMGSNGSREVIAPPPPKD